MREISLVECGSCTRAKHPDGFICFSKTEMSSGSEFPWAGTDGTGAGEGWGSTGFSQTSARLRLLPAHLHPSLVTSGLLTSALESRLCLHVISA